MCILLCIHMDNIMATWCVPVATDWSVARAHTHTQIHTHFYTHTLTYANTYSHTRTYQRFLRSFASFVCITHTHTRITHTHTRITRTHTREHVDTSTYTHIPACPHVVWPVCLHRAHTHANTHTFTHTHVHMYTHTHTYQRFLMLFGPSVCIAHTHT